MELSVRPLIENDIPLLTEYWFSNEDKALIHMGVDPTKLGSRANFIENMKVHCNKSSNELKTCYMVWLIDNKPVGHNALKDILNNEIAHMHLHMWDRTKRGKGYGARLFCMAALEFYRLFDLKMILCEPRSSNPMPNQMLTRIGFKKWKTYCSTPSEISLTCELNSYVIDAGIAKSYLAKVTI